MNLPEKPEREECGMEANIFTEIPNELKTIDVDVEKRIFNVNGVPFGEGCTEFSISCEATEGYQIRLQIQTEVQWASYDMEHGKKKDSRTYHTTV